MANDGIYVIARSKMSYEGTGEVIELQRLEDEVHGINYIVTVDNTDWLSTDTYWKALVLYNLMRTSDIGSMLELLKKVESGEITRDNLDN